MNTGRKSLWHWHPELPPLLKRKESRHITVIGKAFGMSGRAQSSIKPQTEAAPVCCFED